MKILVAATTFPRWKNDTEPPFIYELSRRLARACKVSVLVPHSRRAKFAEQVDSMHILRFPYFFPFALQRVCYDGGVRENLKHSILARLQLPLFLAAEFFSMLFFTLKKRPAIIHAHWIVPTGTMAVVMKKIFGTKVVVTAHAADIFPLRSSFLKKFAAFALNNCDACTVNSTATMAAVKNISHPSNIRIIPMGVDTKKFTPAASKRLKQKISGSPVLLTVGRLAEKKGIRYLIEAMPSVQKKFPHAKLVIAGDGPEGPALKELAKSLRINAVFLGRVQQAELPAYYAAADLFIGPSIVAESGDTEGLGVVFLEAMASGTAVIGTNVGGIPDIIKDGKTGLLVPQKSSATIAAAAIKLLSQPSLRKRLVASGRSYVQQHYSWESVAEKFEKLMEETAAA